MVAHISLTQTVAALSLRSKDMYKYGMIMRYAKGYSD